MNVLLVHIFIFNRSAWTRKHVRVGEIDDAEGWLYDVTFILLLNFF